MEIELNKPYNSYDDGKIRESHRYTVTFTEIIPFEKADKDLVELWECEIEGMEHLYKPKTDVFLRGLMDMPNGSQEEVFYVRAENGWWGLGWWGGQLDYDNSLTEKLEKEMQ